MCLSSLHGSCVSRTQPSLLSLHSGLMPLFIGLLVVMDAVTPDSCCEIQAQTEGAEARSQVPF